MQKYSQITLQKCEFDEFIQEKIYFGTFEHSEYFLKEGLGMLSDSGYLEIADEDLLVKYD